MKKLILSFLLLVALSAGFSNAITDFLWNNISLVIGGVCFVLFFALFMSIGNIWFEGQGQVIAGAFSLSALISIMIMIMPNLSSMVLSILQYSSIFVIGFILIFLVVTIFFSKKKSLLQGISIALLIISLAFIFYLNGGIDLSTGSATESSGSLGSIILISLIALGGGTAIFFAIKKKGSSSSSSSGFSGSSPNVIPTSSNSSSVTQNIIKTKTEIKGKVLNFINKPKGVPVRGLKVTATTNPSYSNLEDVSNITGNFTIKLPKNMADKVTVEKIKITFNGIDYDHTMNNGRPSVDGIKGSSFEVQKGTTWKDVIVPINPASLPLARGEARIKGKVIEYKNDGTIKGPLNGVGVILNNNTSSTTPVTTNASGYFEIIISESDVASHKYEDSKLKIKYNNNDYDQTMMFGLCEGKRKLITPKVKSDIEAVVPVFSPEILKHYNNPDFQNFYNIIINAINSSNYKKIPLSADINIFLKLMNLIDNGAKMDDKFPNTTYSAFGAKNKDDWIILANNFSSILGESGCNHDLLIFYYWNIIMETLIALPGENIFKINTRAELNKLIDDLKNASGALKSKYDKVKI
ncbi:MAG: hypothetical protein PHN56_02845 [Candidatus Nanoarchaeia archaeon]|nr:hypothetical protein [Candidatus Nanoarchaeia archaeon]